MIEKIDANFFGGIEEGTRRLLVLRRQFRLDVEPSSQPHTTHGEARYFQIGVRNYDFFHRGFS
jgi:hypothetical protein